MRFANRELTLNNMKKHSGMRPQDIVILLKILSMRDHDWNNADIANSLNISASEVTEALNRCKIARMIDTTKRKVHTSALKEFLISGLKYVFPVEPGSVVRGVPTAHSAKPISDHISGGNENYVWPMAKGQLRGFAIDPLYRTVPEIVSNDPSLYELLVIADTLRVGRAREIQIAIAELDKRLNNG